jgi:hypothetical protein
MPRNARLATIVSLAALVAVAPSRALAEHGGGGPAGALLRLWQGIKGESRKIDADATRAYESAPRRGSCEERRARIVAALPDALRFARLALDVGEGKSQARMKSARLAMLDLGNGRTAYFQSSGSRYAEVHIDEARRQAVVVFQGTRLSVGSDVSTDVLSFIGLQTGYYRWASALVAQVVREHPDMEVFVTGHSLGGGLAVYAVLRNPGVKGYAFNPAGLGLVTWARTSAADRARTGAALTVISTRNDRHIEPVTAISLAGRSVLPGHILVLDADALGPVSLHSAAAVVAALEQVEASGAAGDVCEGDLGGLAD